MAAQAISPTVALMLIQVTRLGFMTYRAVVVVVAGLSRPRAWAVCRMVTKGTTATRARVSAKVRMVRFVSSLID